MYEVHFVICRTSVIKETTFTYYNITIHASKIGAFWAVHSIDPRQKKTKKLYTTLSRDGSPKEAGGAE